MLFATRSTCRHKRSLGQTGKPDRTPLYASSRAKFCARYFAKRHGRVLRSPFLYVPVPQLTSFDDFLPAFAQHTVRGDMPVDAGQVNLELAQREGGCAGERCSSSGTSRFVCSYLVPAAADAMYRSTLLWSTSEVPVSTKTG
jgi:hypothetical protein